MMNYKRSIHIVNESIYIELYYLFKKNDNSELMSQGGGFTPVEDGDSIRIQVSSITKEYADYVLNAQKELQGTMPIFSGPPANVKSNIKAVSPSVESEVCGFFTAYSKQSSSRVFQRREIERDADLLLYINSLRTIPWPLPPVRKIKFHPNR
ncbi:MAG: DUF4249 domain-containing protein [Prevotellaceae bacterium]|jgi:hypothetical protein|nr:DUF4249 domain-containing protein [Prevotellaceae bacterium]